MSDSVTLMIDGQEVTVPKGTLVIRAAEQLGITIPRFCDHPLLDPIGACRQCMVEVEGQRKPFTACTTQCTAGMVVRTHLQSDVARAAQEAQLEFLLINHPLDCPQCDKGGECPLQDQALAHGAADSRFIDHKRRYEKPVPISELILLDRERCVLCARCTRFSQEISGDAFIELFERGALEQVAIYADEPYHSYFSGNIVQICPVGALTGSDYRFRSRPFDLRTHKGICNQCSAGCNFRVDVRRGEIQRQLAAENPGVNEMWSCDKGRFGYTFVGHPDRLHEPGIRSRTGSLVAVSWPEALRRAAAGLQAALDQAGPQAVGVLSGGRLTDEDAYALSRFAREVLGTDNVDSRLAPREEEVGILAAISGTTGPTYDDVERADVVVVVGLDPEEEVPILQLRLRKAWRKRRQKVVCVGPVLGSLAEIAWRWVRTSAGGEATTLDAIAAPGTAEGLEDIDEALRSGTAVILAGERLARSPGALPAAAELAQRVGGAFAWVPRRSGARGAIDAGLVPGILPGGATLDDPGPVGDVWGRLPDAPGLDTRNMLEAAANGDLRALYLVGVDVAADFEDPGLARSALARADFVAVQDLLPNATTRYADVVLPACAPQERAGSFTTWEGRRQPFEQAVPAPGLAQRDWDITRQLARALGTDLGWEAAADVRREAAPLMEGAEPALDRLSPGPRAAAAPAGGGELGAIGIPRLLRESSTLLVGAKFLLATASPPAVWVNDSDARRLGIADGQVVGVSGPAGRAELPALLTPTVAAGNVVVPAHVPLGPEPLRVTLEAEAQPGGETGAAVGRGGGGAQSWGAQA